MTVTSYRRAWKRIMARGMHGTSGHHLTSREERRMRYESYDDYMDDLGFDEEAYEEGRWNHLEEMRDAESEEREWDSKN